MNKKLLIITALFFTITSCKTPSIMVSDNLKTQTTILEANGRQGWQFNQTITFGDYSTSKIQRGWTKGGEWNFFLRFKKAEQKLSFTQYAPNNESADVFAISKFKSNELEFLKGFLSYSFNYQNTYAGLITPNKNLNNQWEFIIHNPEVSLPKDADCGVARDNKGNEITIRGVKKVEGQANWVKLDNFGFEFIQNGVSIGAVSTINNGRVWIKDNISNELKLIISSISTSLLVRQSMQDSFSK